MLKPGEYSHFDCKLHPFTVRAGVDAYGSCWADSVLFCTSSSYRKATSATKRAMCFEFRKKLASSLDYETFLSLKIEDRFLSQDNCYRKYIQGESSDNTKD